MDVFLLSKILAALEWHSLSSHNLNIYQYISNRYPEILKEVQNEYNHLYLEL